MSNPDREFDRTHLSIDTAEERVLIHRDYVAHCLRWSHVVKCLYEKHAYKTARILDVGCGKEMPLAKLLYSNRMSGAEYCGVDLNALTVPPMLVKAHENNKLGIYFLEQTSIIEVNPEDLPWVPTVITSFECFEHMRPRHARTMLEKLRSFIHDDGVMYFSTPNWNGAAAANHINETKFQAIGAVLQECGWIVDQVYGTFASQRDYLPHLSSVELDVFNRLAEYYDSNLLSIMLAPLHPRHSRNALWVCKPGEKKTGLLKDVPTPWNQHKDWHELGGVGT